MSDAAPVAPPPAAPTPMPRQSASQRFILPALVAARRAFGPIGRDAEAVVVEGRERRAYRYATLHAHLAAITDALLDHNILVEQDVLTMRTSGAHFLVTRLTHAISEEWRCGYLPLPLHPRQDARDAGAVLTYYRRYGLAALLGLAAADDGDEPGSQTRFVDQTEERWGDDEAPFAQEPTAAQEPEPAPAPMEEPAPATMEEPAPIQPPPPAAPPSTNKVIKVLLAAVKESDKPHEIWLGHAAFISALPESILGEVVDRYRKAANAEPPLIDGVTYPPALADA